MSPCAQSACRPYGLSTAVAAVFHRFLDQKPGCSPALLQFSVRIFTRNGKTVRRSAAPSIAAGQVAARLGELDRPLHPAARLPEDCDDRRFSQVCRSGPTHTFTSCRTLFSQALGRGRVVVLGVREVLAPCARSPRARGGGGGGGPCGTGRSVTSVIAVDGSRRGISMLTSGGGTSTGGRSNSGGGGGGGSSRFSISSIDSSRWAARPFRRPCAQARREHPREQDVQADDDDENDGATGEETRCRVRRQPLVEYRVFGYPRPL